MPNRLGGSTSPYLQQHAGNPVDWFEWGQEAQEESLRRDVPILLSVGYAACHWCHVMAHESFEDPATAEVMNAHFVNVKVDREERPDVDAVYMEATQALTGHGGWPMTVFLTPQGRPFYAGTYFPPTARHQLPGFRDLLTVIAQTWRERRDDVEDAGRRIAAALAERALPSGAGPASPDDLAAAVGRVTAEEDVRFGGMGGAPKFPPSMLLEFLLRHAAAGGPEADRALAIAGRTLVAMARSGMYDQVAGGFARYAVDRAWVVPHFEKMLYDNALLARVYLHWWRQTGEATGRRVAAETCDWMLAALLTAEGGLASALDADTPVVREDGTSYGVEGLTYLWTPEELVDVLGEPDGGWAAELLGVTRDGTFEHGTSTAQLTRDVWADPDQARRWEEARRLLRVEREGRPQPGRDDKVVAAWNGLAVAALAETGALLERPDLVRAATGVAELLLDVHASRTMSGALRLRRVSRDGRAGRPAGVLEDYGDVAEGLLALHMVTGEVRWLEAVGRLLDAVLADFADPEGGFFDTAADATDAALAVVRRPRDPTDNAYPSGSAAAAGALLSYAALTGSSRHRRAAEAALRTVAAVGPSAPRAVGWGLAVTQALLDGPREVAVVGPPGDDARQALHRAALSGSAPGCVVTVGEPDAPGHPLLAGRPLVNGTAAAYVCRAFTCDAPTTDPAALTAALGPSGPTAR